jgi:hypothetical protein
MGFALLFTLSALAAFAALAVAVRARLRGRAEIVVAASLIWNAIIVLPIYVLGLRNQLWPRTVAVGSLLTSLAALGLASLGVGLPALARETARTFVRLLRMPFEALALAARPPRFVFVGLTFATLLLPYLAVSAYLGQPLPRWDPLWYHDTIVGFTVQNHGFKMVELPDTLQKVNGYVRLGEMTQLWMVIFTDRRLADIANLIFAPTIVAATYALARRYTTRVLAIGWSVCVLLMPACAYYLHGTYVDPLNAAHVLGAVLFATVDRPRLRDGALTSLGLALSIGSKGLALISAPITGVVGATLLLREHWHRRRGAAIAVVAGGFVLVAATASVTYLRNYLAFHNPLWPDMRVEIPSLGIHWPGQGPWVTETGQGGGTPVNLNESLPKLLDHLFALPFSVHGMWFDQAVEYGIGIVWVALPLAIMGFVAVFMAALRRRLGYTWRAERPPPVAIALILGVMIAGSPALWGARYHVSHVALVCVLAAWFTHRRSWAALEEPAVSAILVTSLMMFWWAPEPRYYLSPERLVQLAHASPLARELDQNLGSPTVTASAFAREKELGPGTLMVFDEHYSGYPSLFWNNTYSNRIQYLRGGPDFLKRAREAGATWINLSPQDPNLAVARQPGSGWQEVGQLNLYVASYAFRRVDLPAPPAPRPGAPIAAPASPPKPPAQALKALAQAPKALAQGPKTLAQGPTPSAPGFLKTAPAPAPPGSQKGPSARHAPRPPHER